MSISKAQQLDTHAEIYNEINQLEVKKLIDKDFSCIKSIDWGNTPKEQVAIKQCAIYGLQNTFYDSWSIQPDDGIIKKMEEGLINYKFFFLFCINQ